MTKPHVRIPFRQRDIFTRPIFNRYTLGWSVLGTLSVAYIGILVFAPDWLDDLTPAATANPQSNQGQRAAARLASNVGNLRESVSQIQLELSKVKTDQEGFAERQNTFATQVTGLEQKLATLAQNKIEAVAPAAANSAPSNQAAVDAPTSLSPEPTPAAAAPAAEPATTPAVQGNAQQPKLINANKSVTTGTLAAGDTPKGQVTTAAASAIDFGPAVVKPAPKPMGIKISSGASIDALRLSWSLLAERHGDTLKNLQPRYTAGGDAQNPSFELIAGPLKSTADAKKACKALAAKNVPCQVGAFAGETL